MMNLVQLNQRFGLPAQSGSLGAGLAFYQGSGGLIYACIENAYGAATISLYAAQVLAYKPRNSQPVLWMSSKSQFNEGKAIRGGIPLCWPWFGPHPEESSNQKPKHGFARTQHWQVVATRALPAATQITLALPCSPSLASLWGGDFTVELTITVGEMLDVSLKTTNLSENMQTLSEALHSYYFVGDAEQVTIAGLDNTRYRDKPLKYAEFMRSGDIHLKDEVDHAYLDTTAACQIIDPVLQRRLLIEKRSSKTTVVWNPGAEKAARMTDMGQEDWRTMVCLEAANAMDNTLLLAPQASHEIGMTVSVLPLGGAV